MLIIYKNKKLPLRAATTGFTRQNSCPPKLCVAKFWRVNKNLGGFTLVEVLITISILVFLATIGIVIGFDSYARQLFRSDDEILITALETARSRSMSNFYQTTHGVCYSAPNFIIFRGTTCVAGEIFPANLTAPPTGLDTEVVVFEQLTGKLFLPSVAPPAEHEIKLVKDGVEKKIFINKQGRINW